MKEKITGRNEKYLLISKLTTYIGNIVFDYANNTLIVNVYYLYPMVLAIYQSSENIIAIIFNLMGGRAADIGNKKKILIITDTLASIVCIIVSIFINASWVGLLLIVANVFLAILKSYNSPVYKAIVSEITIKNRLSKYNSLLNIGTSIFNVTGPIIGVALVNVVGIKGALLFDAATFAVSAIFEARIETVKKYNVKKSTKKLSWINDIINGIHYLTAKGEVLEIVIISSIANFFHAGYNLLLPYTNYIYSEFIDNCYSKILVSQALGGLLGSILCLKFGELFKSRMMKYILTLSGVILLFTIDYPKSLQWILLVPFVLFSLLSSIFNILFISYVQENTDNSYQGRVFSLIYTMAILFVPLGSCFFSKVLNFTNNNGFRIIGIGIMAISLPLYLKNYICKKE
ncbi:MAG: MFS transporter [Pseudobutyrivibrio ruminis]|uniref:MFS transporter n=1 Tax=Pseudobutyrivibrio ruminis TaxID=46206 RepID=UPI0026EC2A27|nr:MFS transporter [Pseudobutyrivibrio ruminis]MBE5913075.1 MFS transporter [Pseudobutyrivibrio ruminis]